MKKYDSYKDSGIEWIGEIPSHWDVTRIKYKFQIGRGRVISNEDLVEDGIYPVYSSQTLNNGCLGFIDTYDFDDKLITWTTDGANAGTVFLREGKFNCTNVCGTLKAKSDEIIPEYDYYFLQYATQFYKRPDTNGAKIMNNEMAVILSLKLSNEEQTAIANYLDQKTSHIDDLIGKKERLIQLLEEERTAIINQAVTKGLDPTVPMKDSGIEWLGEIPANWEVKKLKFLLNENKDALKTGPFGSHIKNTDYVPNGEFKVYTQRNVLDNEFENGCESITEEKFNELRGFAVFEGDILITTRGSIGRCSIFPNGLPLGILHPCLIRIQINEKLSLKNWVVNYINNTSLFYNNVKYNSNSTIIDVIYGYTLKEIFFPVPTITEQREILDSLEIKINEIEDLISKSRQEIELLKEYKTALISEVVTGKVDVRDEILN